jgi:hypothetical protein
VTSPHARPSFVAGFLAAHVDGEQITYEQPDVPSVVTRVRAIAALDASLADFTAADLRVPITA